jgi:hypothetical protein
MNKICTNIKQSKKLIELGIDVNTADMCYYYDHSWSNEHIEIPKIWDNNYEQFIPESEEDDIPAWSLTALMNMLPSEFTEICEYSETTYKIDIRKYALTDDVDLYQIAYGNYKWYEDGSNSWKDMINTGEKEDLLDAVFQMICWLKENNKL